MFSSVPHISLCKHVTPGRGYFWLQGHSLNKRCRGLLDDANMLNILKGYRLYGFRKADFHVSTLSYHGYLNFACNFYL